MKTLEELQAALIEAVKTDQPQVVQSLVEEGKILLEALQVQLFEPDLIEAKTKGKLKLEQSLIAAGKILSENSQVQLFEPALIEAVRKGQLKVVKSVIDESKNLSENSQVQLFEPALIEAVREGQLKVVQSIIDESKNLSENSQVQLFEPALIEAITKDEPKIVQSLIDSSKNLPQDSQKALFNVHTKSKKTLLHFLASKGDSLTEHLLKNGADFLFLDEDGRNVLHLLASTEYVRTAEKVLQFAKEVGMVELRDYQGTVLKTVSAHDLLVNTHTRHGGHAISAHIAASTGNLEMLKLLVEHGSNQRTVDDKGRPLLFRTVVNKKFRFEAMKIILAGPGSDANILDTEGKNILDVMHTAISNPRWPLYHDQVGGVTKAVKFLFGSGFELTPKNFELTKEIAKSLSKKWIISKSVLSNEVLESHKYLIGPFEKIIAQGIIQYAHKVQGQERIARLQVGIKNFQTIYDSVMSRDAETETKRPDYYDKLKQAIDILRTSTAQNIAQDSQLSQLTNGEQEGSESAEPSLNHGAAHNLFNVASCNEDGSYDYDDVKYYNYPGVVRSSPKQREVVPDNADDAAGLLQALTDLSKALIGTCKALQLSQDQLEKREGFALLPLQEQLSSDQDSVSSLDMEEEQERLNLRLLDVVSNGDLAGVKDLLVRGADPSYSDEDGNDALHIALSNKHIEIAQEILKVHTNINASNHNDESHLHIAAQSGLSAIITQILDNDNLHAKNSWGKTPLSQAVVEGHEEVFDMLINAGAKVDCLDDDHNSLLHLTEKSSSMTILKKLIAMGLPIDHPNKFGITPLFNAIFTSVEIARLFLEAGADVNYIARGPSTPKSMSGRFHTPLQYLSELLSSQVSSKETVEMGQLLIAYGAEIKGEKIVDMGEGDIRSINLTIALGDSNLIEAIEKAKIILDVLVTYNLAVDPDQNIKELYYKIIQDSSHQVEVTDDQLTPESLIIVQDTATKCLAAHQSAQQDAQKVASSSQDQPIAASESGQEEPNEVDGGAFSKFALEEEKGSEDASPSSKSTIKEMDQEEGRGMLPKQLVIASSDTGDVSTVQAEQSVASSDIAIQSGSDDVTNHFTEQLPSDMSDVSRTFIELCQTRKFFQKLPY